MEGFLPSSMEDDVNFTSNQFDFQSLLSELELLSPPPEVPVNQSSISCNDQGGQNNVINDSIQQTTPFPTSFPETMMEGFPPSFMEEDDNMTWNQLLSPAPEVPVNQSSILCNDQGGQNLVINNSIQQTTPFPTSFPEILVSTHAYSNLLQCPLN
nr:uncharacterized protein LOC118048642 [Populus alba]